MSFDTILEAVRSLPTKELVIIGVFPGKRDPSEWQKRV